MSDENVTVTAEPLAVTSAPAAGPIPTIEDYIADLQERVADLEAHVSTLVLDHDLATAVAPVADTSALEAKIIAALKQLYGGSKAVDAAFAS